jgi:hypothetical protein
MKFEVNLSKKSFLIGLLIGFFFVGLAGVIAYNTAGVGGNPMQFGHSVDEMDWSKPIPANVSVQGICIGGKCAGSWTEAAQLGGASGGTSGEASGGTSGAEGPWITTRNGTVIFNNVGIGTDSPVKMLDVAGSMQANEICIRGDCKVAWPPGATGEVSAGEITMLRFFYNDYTSGSYKSLIPDGWIVCNGSKNTPDLTSKFFRDGPSGAGTQMIIYICKLSNTCTNGVQDAGESDVDCGGICDVKCAKGKKCVESSDCASGLGCNKTSKTCRTLKWVYDVDTVSGPGYTYLMGGAVKIDVWYYLGGGNWRFDHQEWITSPGRVQSTGAPDCWLDYCGYIMTDYIWPVKEPIDYVEDVPYGGNYCKNLGGCSQKQEGKRCLTLGGVPRQPCKSIRAEIGGVRYYIGSPCDDNPSYSCIYARDSLKCAPVGD